MGVMEAIEKPQKASAEKLPKGIRKLASRRYQVRYIGPDGKRYERGFFARKTDAERARARGTAVVSARHFRG